MENGRGKDDKMSRQMWKEVESRKTDKAKIEETGRIGREKRKKETDDRRRKNNSENNKRKGG